MKICNQYKECRLSKSGKCKYAIPGNNYEYMAYCNRTSEGQVNPKLIPIANIQFQIWKATK
jgi:hypothetical protein